VTLAEAAERLARGDVPPGAELLKRSPVRSVARVGEAVVKVLHRRPGKARGEARALARARALGVPVPELIDAGPGWGATRFVAARAAERDDFPRFLPAVQAMHERGMLHGDLHLGNILMRGAEPLFLDVQKARFLPLVPGWLRRRELGYLAYSLGDPLPHELAASRGWRTLRAQQHWRSRTRRCLVESSGFTAFEADAWRGFRRREIAADALARALAAAPATPALKQSARGALHRVNGWIAKRHASARAARRAWIAGAGLEARGIGCARALAWAGPWLVMEDAGPTVIDWVEGAFAQAGPEERAALGDRAGELLARLHARGIYHPDLKANNVCWTPDGAPRLVDYADVRFGLRVSRRRRVKNLAQLNAALPDLVPGELRERALARYLEELGGDPTDTDRLRRQVIELSVKRRHRWSGCSSTGSTSSRSSRPRPART
jgi:tRNA A-37 threonylcarbamoyl transferase component Bud32